MQRKVIFIHGFGVKKDARGIFTDIQKNFSEDENFKDIKFIFTDLNMIHENGDLFLNPLDTQAEIIQKVYDSEKENSEITLICHSQGCVVASLMKLDNVKKIFLLAPPTNNDLQRSIDRMRKRPGTIINLEDESVVVRSDGSKTSIPASYWENRKDLVYLNCYNSFSKNFKKENIKIILANQDEIVANDAVDSLEKIGEVFKIDGDHNFTKTRTELILTIKIKLA